MRRRAYPAELPDARPEPATIMAPYLFLMGPDSAGFTGRSIDCQ
jgi:hypothetical protein